MRIYLNEMSDKMNKINTILIDRCIKVIVMMIPSFFWISIVMLDICVGIAHNTYAIIINIILGLLIFTMLFLNEMIKITFLENTFEHIQYTLIKPNKHNIIHGLITGLPLVLILFFMPYWMFILYGVIQFFYIILDKEHLSIMERIYIEITRIVSNKYKKDSISIT